MRIAFGRQSLNLVACALGILPTVSGVNPGQPQSNDPIASMENGPDLSFAVGDAMHTVPRLASSDFRAGDGAPVICDDAEYRCFVPDEMADLCPIIYSVKATSKKNSACSQQLLSTAACHHDGKKSDCYVNDNFAVPAWRFVRPLPPAWYRVV